MPKLWLSAAVSLPQSSSSHGGLSWQVTALMRNYLSKFQLAPMFTEDEVEHYLLPVEDVIDSHVVESPSACPSACVLQRLGFAFLL